MSKLQWAFELKLATLNVFGTLVSLFGLCQSPCNYFLYTKEKLESMNFVPSIADPCIFMSVDVICLIYVDDALLFYKNKTAMESLTLKMKNDGMLFREEDSVAGYLGVHIYRLNHSFNPKRTCKSHY